MRKLSAGCLVLRDGSNGPEVLLVHPRGATFRKPLFGIPKGEVEPGEDERNAAERETLEETGLRVAVTADLGSIRQKSGKEVHAFLASVAPESAALIDVAGRCASPDGENDVCGFFSADAARERMIPAQRELLDRALRIVVGE